MDCPDGKVFAPGNWPKQSDGISTAFGSETYMNNFPAILNGAGFTCENSRAYLLANSGSLFAGIVKDGSAFQKPSESNVELTGEFAGGQLYIDNNIYGSFGMGPDGFFDEITWPGPWPIIMGVDAQSVQVQIGSSPDNATLTILNCPAVMQSFDFNLWFCCAAAPFGCTEGCGASIPMGGRFLIPPPANPGPGENVSTPILGTPLYLSNHTFQFTANYGRVPK